MVQVEIFPWLYCSRGSQRAARTESLEPQGHSTRAVSREQVSLGEAALAKQPLAITGVSCSWCSHVQAEQSPELLPDTTPVGSFAGSCLLQSQGGACMLVLPLRGWHSASMPGCL